METYKGIITKGIGGFYYVEVADATYECKARGVFRKNKITPLIGDYVDITVNDNAENTIDKIYERKNFLNRPPVSNIDNLIIVVSTALPRPNFLVIDKLVALAEHKGIEPIIVISKTDLSHYNEIYSVYEKTGICVIPLISDESLDKLKDVMNGCVNAFTGNSGVGKTTLLNKLDGNLALSTGEISEKLGRGRHTTRQAQLFKVCGGYVIDTPGFSSLEFEKNEIITKEDLPYCFREFREYLGFCKFSSCTHINDKGCKIVEAVNDGKINPIRHENYAAMYAQAKEIKKWEL
ncbi:MAG: ribosome small subunit-dependent GTPase A [Oscillospiraceae bacterium]|nr:ribosome small subunit-dependent GTPase A [Oscillospiraceae bacterium]